MNRVTRSSGSSGDWDSDLTREITFGFLQELTTAEVNLIPSMDMPDAYAIVVWIIEHDPEHPPLIEKFDRFLLYLARTAGPRIVLSRLVQRRMYDWASEEGGPEKLQKIGVAMAHGARVLQWKAPPPVTDPDWYPFRMETIQELKLLFRQLASMIRLRPRRVSIAEVCDLVSVKLEQSPEGFGLLRRNADSFREFLHSGKSPIAPLLVGEKAHPAQFFDQWMGWATGRDPERFRQDVSRIGSRKSLRP